MGKNGIIKRIASKTILAGLLINLLPATLLVRAQQPPVMGRATQQVSSRVRPKLSKEEIDKKLKSIKKTIKIFQTVNIVLPLLIAGVGLLVFLVATVVTGVAIERAIAYHGWEKESFSTSMTGKPTGVESVKYPKPILGEWGLPIAIPAGLAALVSLISTPVLTFLSAIGLFGATVGIAFHQVEKLEQMEKDHPGTLTKKQKLVLVQFKNLAKKPFVRGAMKSRVLKEAHKAVVLAALEKNPMLGSVIAFGQPKEARKIIGRYIKLKWMMQSAQKAVSQIAKETEPDLQKPYKKAVKELQKLKQKVAALDGEYPILATASEIKAAVKEFGNKVDRVIEELKKPVIEEKLPVVVPL